MSNLPLVLLDPLLRRVVRRVRAPGAEVHEERLVGRDHLRVLDELDRLVGQVGREVVAVLRAAPAARPGGCRRQVGIPLVRLAAEEAVEALEAAADRPVALRRGHVHLVGRAQVPLAEHVRVPSALPHKDLGDSSAHRRTGDYAPFAYRKKKARRSPPRCKPWRWSCGLRPVRRDDRVGEHNAVVVPVRVGQAPFFAASLLMFGRPRSGGVGAAPRAPSAENPTSSRTDVTGCWENPPVRPAGERASSQASDRIPAVQP
jgi:hypothetical protein